VEVDTNEVGGGIVPHFVKWGYNAPRKHSGGPKNNPFDFYPESQKKNDKEVQKLEGVG